MHAPSFLALSPLIRWRIVLMMMVFAGLGHLNRVGISVAGDEVFIPVVKIPETSMGWVYTTFLIVYTIGMLPGSHPQPSVQTRAGSGVPAPLNRPVASASRDAGVARRIGLGEVRGKRAEEAGCAVRGRR